MSDVFESAVTIFCTLIILVAGMGVGYRWGHAEGRSQVLSGMLSHYSELTDVVTERGQ